MEVAKKNIDLLVVLSLNARNPYPFFYIFFHPSKEKKLNGPTTLSISGQTTKIPFFTTSHVLIKSSFCRGIIFMESNVLVVN